MMNLQGRQEQLDIKPSGWMPYERILSANYYLLSDAERLGQSRSDKPTEGPGNLVSDLELSKAPASTLVRSPY